MSYAVIRTGGKQYKVSEGDVVDVEKLDLEPGAEARLDDVLFYSEAPEGPVTVVAEVVEQRKAPKVIAYKYKRRKGYHRTVGHRRRLTRLKIKSILPAKS